MWKFWVALSARLLAPTTTRGLITGASLFLALKLAFVSFGMGSMNGPRIGDDSYVYLWFTKSNYFNQLRESPGVRAIESFASQIDRTQLDEKARFERDRVMLRIPGYAEIFPILVTAPLIESPISYYTMFWAQEVLIAIVMAAGFGVLFAARPRPPGLALLLPLLALAFLPLQGLHFLIPSTLALSFGMVCWGLVLMHRPRPVLLFAAGAMAMLSHPIGILHAGIAGLLALVLFARRVLPFRTTVLHALPLLGVLALFVALVATGVKGTQKIDEVTRLGLSEMPYNLKGLAWQAIEFLRRDPLATITSIAGLIALIRMRGLGGRGSLLVLLAGAALVSCLYSLQAYPGEAATRMFVPILAVLFLHAYAAAPSRASGEPWTGLSYAAFLAVMSVQTVLFAYESRDGRIPDISHVELAGALGAVGPDSHLLYVDGDMAMQAAFVAGAERNFTSSLALLETAPAAAMAWLDQNPVGHVITSLPDALLTTRGFRRSLFEPTSYGFDLMLGRLQLEVPPALSQLRLIEFGNGIVTLQRDGKSCEGVRSGPFHDFDLTSCAGSAPLVAGGTGFVGGILLAGMAESLNWPWGTDIRWTFEQSGWFGTATVKSGSFDLPGLDKRLASPILDGLRPRLVPVDDRSGVVFLKVQ